MAHLLVENRFLLSPQWRRGNRGRPWILSSSRQVEYKNRRKSHVHISRLRRLLSNGLVRGRLFRFPPLSETREGSSGLFSTAGRLRTQLLLICGAMPAVICTPPSTRPCFCWEKGRGSFLSRREKDRKPM